jgi:hypothetical protein
MVEQKKNINSSETRLDFVQEAIAEKFNDSATESENKSLTRTFFTDIVRNIEENYGFYKSGENRFENTDEDFIMVTITRNNFINKKFAETKVIKCSSLEYLANLAGIDYKRKKFNSISKIQNVIMSESSPSSPILNHREILNILNDILETMKQEITKIITTEDLTDIANKYSVKHAAFTYNDKKYKSIIAHWKNDSDNLDSHRLFIAYCKDSNENYIQELEKRVKNLKDHVELLENNIKNSIYNNKKELCSYVNSKFKKLKLELTQKNKIKANTKNSENITKMTKIKM